MRRRKGMDDEDGGERERERELGEWMTRVELRLSVGRSVAS